MRHLHPRHPRGGQGPARAQPRPERGRNPLLAGGQPVPLHRLRQDHSRGDGYRRRHAEGFLMALDDRSKTREFKVIGTRPVRPDGIDKVTGRAKFGADATAPGMLTGRVVRSPHPHARIRRIDASKAEALPGVKAVVTRADFGEVPEDVFDILDNCMAGEKALYDGHAVAAVAASSPAVAKRAAKLIEVEYDPLPHVTDVDEAMKPEAPALHEGRTEETVPEGMSPNVISRVQFGHGDVE